MIERVQFHPADIVIITVMLAVSLGIGVYFAAKSRKKNTKDEYLLGSRNMGTFPVALSTFVSFQSAVSLIGVPAEMYTYGTMFCYFYIAMMATYVVSAFTLVPLIHPLKITSMYEYLGMRFDSSAVRLLATVIGMLQTIAYMAIALLSPALALQAAADLPLWMSVVIVSLVGTVYTALGGIKSVVWTDVFQTVILFVGIFAVLVRGLMEVGGFGKVFEIAKDEHRIQFNEVNVDPRIRHTVWGLIIGGFFNWFGNCLNQASIQRLSSLKTMNKAKIAYILVVPMCLFYGIFMCFTGILLFAYFYNLKCDPYKAGFITNRNQLMPYFVMHVLGSLPGMPGLYMATLFSGALSTLSSGINALAANTVEDILRVPLKNCKPKMTTQVARAAVCVYGLLIIGLAYAAKSLQGPVTQMAISAIGACAGPIIGIYVLGALFPFSNKIGAMFGLFISIVLNLWITIGGQMYGSKPAALPSAPISACSTLNSSDVIFGGEDYLFNQTTYRVNVTSSPDAGLELGKSPERPFFLYDLSYCWFALTGFLTAVIAGVIISLISGRGVRAPVDPRLMFPFARRMWSLTVPDESEQTTLSENKVMTPIPLLVTSSNR